MNNNLNRFELTATSSIFVFIISFSFAAPALAYVGPGMDFGTLGAAFGVLMTGVSAVFYLCTLWLRQLWRRITRMTLVPDGTAETSTMRRDP